MALIFKQCRLAANINASILRPLFSKSSSMIIPSKKFSNENNLKTETTAEFTENEKKMQDQIDSLTKDLQDLQKQNAELLDKYKRSLADSENLRVRLTKQIDDAKVFGIQGFCKDLLEVADILGHATQAVPENELNNNKHLKNLFEGLSMTQATLNQVFKRHGLEQISPIKEKFDPNFHEALFQKEDSSVEVNTVIEVSKVGYKLQKRCIRPALVGVSK